MSSSDSSSYAGWAISIGVAAILVVPMWSWLGRRPTIAIAVGMGTFFLQLWLRRIRAGDAVAGAEARRGSVRGFNRQLFISLSAALLAWYLAEPFG